MKNKLRWASLVYNCVNAILWIGFACSLRGADQTDCPNLFSQVEGKTYQVMDVTQCEIPGVYVKKGIPVELPVWPKGFEKCEPCVYKVRVVLTARVPTVGANLQKCQIMFGGYTVINSGPFPNTECGDMGELTADFTISLRSDVIVSLAAISESTHPNPNPNLHFTPGNKEPITVRIDKMEVKDFGKRGDVDFSDIPQGIIFNSENGKSCDSCGGGAVQASSPPGFALSLRGSATENASEDITGHLQLNQDVPPNTLYTPQAVYFTSVAAGFERVHAGTNQTFMRQVKGTDGLLHIVKDNDFKFHVDQFPASSVGSKVDGIYQTTGSPIATVTVHNPDESHTTTNRINIVEQRGSNSITNQYVWNSANQGWSATKAGGLTSQRQVIQWTNNNTVRIQTTEVLDSNNVVLAKQEKRFGIFSWGEALLGVNNYSGTASPSASYTYWTNTSDSSYRKVKEVFQPSGSWSGNTYDTNGRPIALLSPFLNQTATTNQALVRLTTFDYTPLAGSGDLGGDTNHIRTKVEYLLNQEISRRYWIILPGEEREIQCQIPGASWTNLNNLITVTKFYTNGFASNLVQSVLSPNGTLTVYEYATNSAYRTNIVFNGQANSNFSAVINGTKTIEVLNISGHPVLKSVFDIASNVEVAKETYSNFDSLNRPRRIDYLDGSYKEWSYGCCGVEWERDRDGVITNYEYDDLKRVTRKTRLGIGMLYTYDAASRVIKESRVGTDGGTNFLKGFKYDLAGKVEAETNALMGVTYFSEGTNSSGGISKTNVFPDTGTRIEVYARDGSLMEVKGTAVRPIKYEYGVEEIDEIRRPYVLEVKLDSTGTVTNEWTKTYKDMVGRDYKTIYAVASGSHPFTQRYYNNKGQLWKQVDPDGVTMLYGYNAKGEQEYSVVDMNRNDVIDLAGPDRVTRAVSDIVTNYGTQVLRSRTYVWGTNYVDSATLVSTAEKTMNGMTNWNTSFGILTKSEAVLLNSTSRVTKVISPDNSSVTNLYVNGRLQSTTHRDASHNQLSHVSYTYDAQGRQWTVTDARNGTTTLGYNNADLVTTVTTPSPGGGQSSQVTTTYYDTMLRAWKVTYPDNTSVTNEFYVTGDLKKTLGSRAYPVEFTYDAQGRKKTMKTWSDLNNGYIADTKTWYYDSYRGFMTNSTGFSQSQTTYDPVYTYKPSGKLASRISARTFTVSLTTYNVTTSYDYNPAGDLETISYNDGITPPVVNTYDRLGRKISCNQNGVITENGYSESGLMLWERSQDKAVNYNYDSLLRLAQVQATVNGNEVNKAVYNYGAASRLGGVSNGVYSAHYEYEPNSPLMNKLVFKDNGTTRQTTTRQFDYLNRLTLMSNAPSVSLPLTYAYLYNMANQRTQMNLGDGSYWKYNYDSMGQLTSGRRYWRDNSQVAGQQYTYTFDDIGNRKQTQTGGDNSGGGLNLAYWYSTIAHRQLSRNVPGYIDVTGIANGSATVTVNGQTTTRKNEYYHRSVAVNNSSAPVYQTIDVAGVLEGTSQTKTGNVFVPQNSEQLSYDADGNMLGDGRWDYTWDAENRLIRMQAKSSVPDGAKRKLEFEYDCQGRRRRKAVYDWQASSTNYVITAERRYIYDGWNLLAEVDRNNSVVGSYTWGTDLSGSRQGAGGVGGLLMVSSQFPMVTRNFVDYDGNGNVTGLIDASTGTSSAVYEYGPFGEPIRVSGPMAKSNPFRWSTKYTDEETDLVYYGYRYYSPTLGRWLSRDPIEERGGLNLYGYLNNDSINRTDRLGLEDAKASLRTILHSILQEYSGSLIASALGLQASITELESVLNSSLVRVKIDPSAVGSDNSATFDRFKSTLSLENSSPNRFTLAHELVHADLYLFTPGFYGYRAHEGLLMRMNKSLGMF